MCWPSKGDTEIPQIFPLFFIFYSNLYGIKAGTSLIYFFSFPKVSKLTTVAQIGIYKGFLSPFLSTPRISWLFWTLDRGLSIGFYPTSVHCICASLIIKISLRNCSQPLQFLICAGQPFCSSCHGVFIKWALSLAIRSGRNFTNLVVWLFKDFP